MAVLSRGHDNFMMPLSLLNEEFLPMPERQPQAAMHRK